ncbi:hypothetical protein ACK8HX_16625 [Oryzobacter sp. R7]|uniref:hypothetical protein n=1 Tax=Oryzobacter faecalis TaxID=3388656 RepID=UPI00398D08EA
MAKRSIQGFVELASGLGELTRSRAQEAATELLTLTGVEGSGKKAAKQAGRLAEDLLVAAEANRKQVVRLVRSEVESAISRVDVGRLVSEVQGLGATVAALAAQVDDLARSAAGRPSSPVARVVEVEPEPARVAPRPAAPARKAPATTTAKAPARKAPARKAPARKAPAAKASTTKAASTTPARKAPAKKTTKTTAAKTTPTKATAKKATKATAKKATKAPAKKATKATAKKATKAPAKKATKAPAKKATKSAAKTSAGGTSS